MSLLTDPDFAIFKLRKSLLSNEDSFLERVVSLPTRADSDYVATLIPASDRKSKSSIGRRPSETVFGGTANGSPVVPISSHLGVGGSRIRQAGASRDGGGIGGNATTSLSDSRPSLSDDNKKLINNDTNNLPTVQNQQVSTPSNHPRNNSNTLNGTQNLAGLFSPQLETSTSDREQRARQTEMVRMQLQKIESVKKFDVLQSDNSLKNSNSMQTNSDGKSNNDREYPKESTSQPVSRALSREPSVRTRNLTDSPSTGLKSPLGLARHRQQGSESSLQNTTRPRGRSIDPNTSGNSLNINGDHTGSEDQSFSVDGSEAQISEFRSYEDSVGSSSFKERMDEEDGQDGEVDFEHGSISSSGSMHVNEVEGDSGDEVDWRDEDASSESSEVDSGSNEQIQANHSRSQNSTEISRSKKLTPKTMTPIQPDLPQESRSSSSSLRKVLRSPKSPKIRNPEQISSTQQQEQFRQQQVQQQSQQQQIQQTQQQQQQQRQYEEARPSTRTTPNLFAKTLPSTHKPVSALSSLISERISNDNPFAKEYAFFSGKGIPDAIRLKIFVPFSDNFDKPLHIAIRPDATVDDVIGYALFEYFNEKRTPRLPHTLSDIGLWSMRIVEDDGSIDQDFPALERSRKVQKFAFDQFALCECQPNLVKMHIRAASSGLAMAKTESHRQNPTSPISPNVTQKSTSASSTTASVTSPTQPSANSTVFFLKVHLYSTLEVKQTTTVQMPGNTLLSDVFEYICKKRKYDSKVYVLKMPDTKTDVPLNKTLDQLKVTEFCVLKKDSGAKGDIFLRPPDEARDEPTLEQPRFITSDEYSNMYKQYHVMHKHFMGRHDRLLTIDGDYIHLMAPESKILFDRLKTNSYHISMVTGCRQSKQSANFKLTISKNNDTRAYELEAASGAEAAEICQRIAILLQLNKRDGSAEPGILRMGNDTLYVPGKQAVGGKGV
ncbi:hypothetical protein HK098_006133 [Nowakowskiella sp. JEL0407]|nr:hypothetical protein HK098_006133 [Nowakowskiella sp. JEL0407]